MHSVEKATTGEERTATGMRLDIQTELALGTTATDVLPERPLMPLAIGPG